MLFRSDGVGITPQYPTLAGQHPDYLVRALTDYKRGGRKNAIMSGFASQLSDADIKAIAAYYSAQRPGLEVHHRQADLSLVVGLTPAVQRGQGVEFAFDGPISAHASVLPTRQPHPKHFLQLHGPRMAVHQGLALTQQLAAQQGLVARRQER